jgi:pyrimidine operon attenuation protein / uracil phosphoribosyltransferase
MTDPQRQMLLDEQAVRRVLSRMARELLEQVGTVERLALIGIHRRGVDLANWLAQEIERAEGVPIATGSLDITLYRDDLMAIGPRPVVGETRLPREGIGDRVVAIVDDVLFTGRTVRAALDELTDFGRPRRILLCVLVDRGGRELPIHADIVGKKYTVAENDRVEVMVPELDGELGVALVKVQDR